MITAYSKPAEVKFPQTGKYTDRKLIVSIPEYWEYPAHNRPETFDALMQAVRRRGGFWRLSQLDRTTGQIIQENWCENLITDNGALSMWKNTMNYTAGGIAVANIIAVDQSLTYTTLNGALTAGATITTVTVNALTGPTIPSGSTLILNAGQPLANQLQVTTTAAITGAGTFAINSATVPAGGIPNAANIKMVPTTTDASSLSAPVSYTAALPTGNFTISGSGVGNRQMQVANTGNYLFSTSSNSNSTTATAANYTAAWLVNANPVASTANTFIHVAFDAPLAVNASFNGQVTIVEKI